MKIAIIDSGVDVDNINLGNHILFCKHFFYTDGCICSDNDVRDHVGHGTAIFNILLDEINKSSISIEIFVIKIFENELETDHNLIIEALQYCKDNEIDYINLSLGTPVRTERMESLCKDLFLQGSIIIAAHKMNYYNVFPACYETVISICAFTDEPFLKSNEIIYINDENGRYNVVAYANKTRVKWLNQKNIIVSGVSFACPKILVRLLCLSGYSKITFEEAIHILQKDSISNISYKDNLFNLNIEGNTALFPFNKEMHSLIRFGKQLRITQVFDVRGRGIVGKYIGDIVGNINVDDNPCNEIANLRIDDISTTSGDEYDFSSIIIGDVQPLMSVCGSNIHKFLKKIAESGKKIYSFIPLYELFPDIESICLPILDDEVYRKEILPSVGVFSNLLNLKPVVGILGTSKNQGKFTLQMRLKRHLNKREIVASLLSTEHQSALLDVEASFPYGAHSSSLIRLNDKSMYNAFDYMVFNLSLRRSHIIITGLQSGLLSEDYNDRKRNIANIALLSVMRPELSVLVINDFDSKQRIRKTIALVSSMTNRKLVCLAIRIHGEDDPANNSKEVCEKYYNEFKIPCFNINDVDSIADSIISAFN